jgi:hypothetical protein
MAATAGTKRQHSATNGSNVEGQPKGSTNKKARVESSGGDSKKADKPTPYRPTPYKKSYDNKKGAGQGVKRGLDGLTAVDENGVLNGMSIHTGVNVSSM